MEKSEGNGKEKKLLLIVGIWLALGIIACAVIVVKSLGEEGSLQQQVVAENVEKAEALESAASLPAFKKESGLSEAEKLRNPLIMNHVGNVRVLTNMMGKRLGVAQIVKLSEKDFDSITAKNLKDFWLECNFEGWMFVFILENESNENTGRGMVINQNGKSARYGYLNADEAAAGVEFGTFYETVREFFYLSDEKDFQYFNSDDPDDEGLKRFKDSDKVFASKIN